MNLPLDGAVILSSTAVNLDLSDPTHTQDTASGIVDVLTEAFMERGYTKAEGIDMPSMRVVKLNPATQGDLSISLHQRKERPSISITEI